MIIKTIISLVISLLLFSNIFSQSAEIEFAFGHSGSNFFFKSNEIEMIDTESPYSGSKFDFGVTTKINNGIYLGSKIGFNSPRSALEFIYNEDLYNGVFRKDQVFIGLYPEYRFFKRKNNTGFRNIIKYWIRSNKCSWGNC